MRIDHITRGAPAFLWRGAALLFFVAMPWVAFAQDSKASGSDGGSTATTTEAPQATTEQRGVWLLAEPHFVEQSLELSKRFFGDGTGPAKSGFYPELSNMVTGSGFISAGPGYRYNFMEGKAFFDTSGAVSWHLYKMAQARLEFSELADSHLTLGAQAMWQDATQVSYFGLGSDHLKTDQSQYRMKTTDIVGYTALRPNDWLSIGAELGWLKRPVISETAGTFNPDYPYAPVLYPTDPGMSEPFQPNYVHAELSVMANTLNSRSHPTEGGLYRGALTTFFDQSYGHYSFNQYEGEIVQMVPLGDRRVVLGLHGWTVFSETGAGHEVPFYLMPYIGGNNTLRGYDDYQFHGQNTITATAELRVALLAHLDLAGFYDAGNVAAKYTDLNFDKRDWGAGLRLHMRNTTFARMDMAHGSEGWKFIFRTSDPFKLSRITRRLAAVPFLP